MPDQGDPDDAKNVTLTPARTGAAVRDPARSAYVLRADPSGAVAIVDVTSHTPEIAS